MHGSFSRPTEARLPSCSALLVKESLDWIGKWQRYACQSALAVPRFSFHILSTKNGKRNRRSFACRPLSRFHSQTRLPTAPILVNEATYSLKTPMNREFSVDTQEHQNAVLDRVSITPE